MIRTCVGPGEANTGADENHMSSWAAGHTEGSALARPWTDAEVLAWIAAVRHIARYTHRDVRWALPADVREELAA